MTTPSANNFRESNFVMIMPTMGMAMNEPIPRGAMAMPACSGG